MSLYFYTALSVGHAPTETQFQQHPFCEGVNMQGNVILGILLPIVFCGSVLTLVFLWMKNQGTTAQQERARNAFAKALASKNIKVDPVDVATKRGAGGTILCSITYGRTLYANGEYRRTGRVFVRYYPRPDGDPDWSFWHPATTNP
jgi:hypothetical protein